MSKAMQEIAGPEPITNFLSLLKFFRAFNKDSLGMLQTQKDNYGAMSLIEILGDKQLIISDPELFREVLVTKAKSFHKGHDYKDTKKGLARFLGNGIIVSDGEFWKKQRKLVQPAFHVNRIKEYADTMGQYTDDMLEDWQGLDSVDVAHEMMMLTLRIVARTLFHTDVRENATDIATTMEAMNETSGKNTLLPTWIPTPQELLARKAVRDMDDYVYALIAERRQHEEDKGDLLSMLLLAEDDDGKRMSDKEVRDEAVGLFLAGHETTANALNWVFYLLAKNPDVTQKLHEELDRVLAGRTPSMQDLRALPYTEMVIKEAMRWMPPVSGVGRIAIEDVEIGDYLIKKDTSIFLNFYSVHHDENYWDNPSEFLPERFAPENDTDRHRYAYLPFGGGARVCVGNSFAMMEAQILLATIAQKYTLSLAKKQEVVPVARITTYPQNGLPMSIKKRVPNVVPEFA